MSEPDRNLQEWAQAIGTAARAAGDALHETTATVPANDEGPMLPWGEYDGGPLDDWWN